MSSPGRRYAILRDLDDVNLRPFGVLFETPDGGATIELFGRSTEDAGLRRDFSDFDAAINTWRIGALISAYGREGESDADQS